MKPTGDCFKAAYDRATSLTDEQNKTSRIYVVHGSVIPTSGPWAQKRITHAWVQVDDMIYEFSNANNRIYSKSIFERIFSTIVHKSYTPDDANLMVLQAENYGPWDQQSIEMGEKE